MTRIIYVLACACCLSAVLGVIGLYVWSDSLQDSLGTGDRESAGFLFGILRYLLVLGGLGQVLPLLGLFLFWVFHWAEGYTSMSTWIIIVLSAICALAMGGTGLITGVVVLIVASTSSNIAFWSD